MSQDHAPPWYDPGDIEQSLRGAFQEYDVSVEEVVDVLAEHELDAPRDRLLTMVKTTREQLTNSRESALTTPSLDDTRANQARFIDLPDLEYLGARDVASLIGTMLSRFDGSFRVPEVIDEQAANLLWTRSDTTIGIWIEWRPAGTPVDTPAVQSIVSIGTQSVSDGDCSEIAIVSNVGFTDEARRIASEHDMYCCGPECLRRWCREAQLTDAVAGEIVDGESTASEECDEILDQLPPLPASIPAQDPLQPVAETEWTTSTLDKKIESTDTMSEDDKIDTTPSSQSGMSEPHAPSESGQRGVLYADPDEDGDFDAFDRFTESLADEDNA